MFLFSFSAFAQSGIIQGTITDARTNETLAGATVMIQGTTVGAAATVDGTYEIRNVQPGTITLEVRYIGFNVMRRGITIEAGLTTERQKAELRAQLDRSKALGLNAVVFQVRPATDAIYQSDIEPWSEYLTGKQGVAPDPMYDPLAFVIEEAHKRGLELHAWFNPFRSRHSSGSHELEIHSDSRRVMLQAVNRLGIESEPRDFRMK